MAQPGSNAFDRDRARLRKDLEDSGLNDQRANEAAKAKLLDSDKHRPPRPDEVSDRARGPYGER